LSDKVDFDRQELSKSSQFLFLDVITPEENNLVRSLSVVSDQWILNFEMFLTELADTTTGIMAFYQAHTSILQITLSASEPKVEVMFASRNISIGEVNVGTWNRIFIEAKYPPSKNRLKLITKVNTDLIMYEDYYGVLPSLTGASIYTSQPGLSPMHGQIRNLEFCKFFTYLKAEADLEVRQITA